MTHLPTIPYPVNASGIMVNKQLLDGVYVISRIIKVDVRAISRSRRLKITLTETLAILGITKPNLIIVLLYIERKNGKQAKMISLPVTLSVLDTIIV